MPQALGIRREFPEKVMPGLNSKGGNSRMALPGTEASTNNWGLRGAAGLAHSVSCKLFSAKGE